MLSALLYGAVADAQEFALAPGVSGFGSGYADPSVHMVGNMVVLSGVVRPGSGTIGTLPASARPAGRMVFIVWSGSNPARVDVLPDGRVSVVTGGSSWISLNGIVFPAQ